MSHTCLHNESHTKIKIFSDISKAKLFYYLGVIFCLTLSVILCLALLLILCLTLLVVLSGALVLVFGLTFLLILGLALLVVLSAALLLVLGAALLLLAAPVPGGGLHPLQSAGGLRGRAVAGGRG